MIDQQFLSAKYDGLQMDGKMLKEASYTTSGERVFITQAQLKLLDSHKTSHIQRKLDQLQIESDIKDMSRLKTVRELAEDENDFTDADISEGLMLDQMD